ncbi:MAG: hypothetical protein WBG42_16255 [Cryomorphaceae bacterium]
MKTILMIVTMGLLFSCTEKEIPEKTILTGSNHQLEAIKKDIESKYASLSFEQKLEFCLLDFSFASPKVYKDLLEHPPDDVKATLLENEVFLKICESRKIDPNDIHKDYFSAKK